jgi:DUF1680 family protein
MALLTGHARYGDLIERTLFNGFLAGMSLDGERWLYVNPLQVRDGHAGGGGDQAARRTRWFRCACCPPNAMRLLAGLQHYVASTDDGGLQLHQYATGHYAGEVAGTRAAVRVDTDFPWSGIIRVTVEEGPSDRPWTLSLRIPSWAAGHRVRLAGRDLASGPVADGWLRLERAWTPGEEVVLDLPMAPRLTQADPRVDAVRGCAAIERGPLVYCLEGVDHPGGGLDDVVIDPRAPLTEDRVPGLLGGVTTVTAAGHRRTLPEPLLGWWPYRDATSPNPSDAPGQPHGTPLKLTAVPYYAWANRSDGPMRVWIPTR